MRTWTLEREQWLPRPIGVVFPFFADPANLDALTPPRLRFRILTPAPIAMRPGALIDYSLRLRGVPMKWRTRITAFEPPHRFVDEQLRGPYAKWVHTHTFTPQQRGGAEGTLVKDHVEYALPRWLPGPVAALVHRLLVRRDLTHIFAFRERVLAEKFAGEPSLAAPAAQ